MNDDDPDVVVSADWLSQRLGADDLAVIDASWYLPALGRDGAEEYRRAHIPGAAFFDLDAVADHASGLPHMLPDAQTFARAVGAMGVGDATRVVVYDGLGLFSAPRLWWMFKVFGHGAVAVLDGGLPAWIAAGHATTAEPAPARARAFTPMFDAALVADIDDVAQALRSASAQVLDARPAARFAGLAPEPRPGLRAGHMPGSRNLPASEVVAAGRLKSAPDLVATFEAAGADWSRPVITSCGSGVSAALLTLALARAGKPQGRLYDSSWSEWGARSDRPVEPA